MTGKSADNSHGGSTRDRLARAAVELFESKGFASTTIDEIATRAGIGRRTFFRYYRSKEDVIFPDHERILAKVRERLDAFPNELAIDAICHAVRLVLAHYSETRNISLQRYRLVSEVPTLREREIVSAATYQRLFRERLERDQPDGEMAALRAELVASAIATAHNLVLRQWLRQGGTSDPFPNLDRALELVREIFEESETGLDHMQNSQKQNSTVVIMAFDDSVKNETIARELERVRKSVKTIGATLATQERVPRNSKRGTSPRPAPTRDV